MTVSIHIQADDAALALREMRDLLSGTARLAPEPQPDKPSRVPLAAAVASGVATVEGVAAAMVGGADTQADESTDKPSVYRAKNAEKIAKDILAKVKADHPLDANDLDDMPRLPKKWQTAIADAIAAANSAAGAEPVDFVLYNDDGAVFDTYATPQDWLDGIVERASDASSIEELDGLAKHNRVTCVDMMGNHGVAQEFFAPMSAVFIARTEALSAPASEEQAAEPAPAPAAAETPSVPEALEAKGEAMAHLATFDPSDASVEHVRAAVNAMVETFGIDEANPGSAPAVKALQAFKAGKVSELKEEVYPAFLKVAYEQLFPAAAPVADLTA